MLGKRNLRYLKAAAVRRWSAGQLNSMLCCARLLVSSTRPARAATIVVVDHKWDLIAALDEESGKRLYRQMQIPLADSITKEPFRMGAP
jgi:hypothetical protein